MCVAVLKKSAHSTLEKMVQNVSAERISDILALFLECYKAELDYLFAKKTDNRWRHTESLPKIFFAEFH